MKSGNQDRAEGTAKDIKGRVKEAAGSLTRNPRLKAEGRADQAHGRAQKAIGKVKRAVGV